MKSIGSLVACAPAPPRVDVPGIRTNEARTRPVMPADRAQLLISALRVIGCQGKRHAPRLARSSVRTDRAGPRAARDRPRGDVRIPPRRSDTTHGWERTRPGTAR